MVLVAELPGVKKETLNIEAKGNTIRLAGERTIEYDENVSYHRVERKSSKFDRTLKLPASVLMTTKIPSRQMPQSIRVTLVDYW